MEHNFVVIVYGCGVPALDDHISGKQKIPGMLYSPSAESFLTDKETYNRINQQYGLDRIAKNENDEQFIEIHNDIEEYIHWTLADSVDIKTLYNLEIHQEVSDWAESIFEEHPSVADFSEGSDWVDTFVKITKLYILQTLQFDLNHRFNILRKELLEGNIS
jgi:hypothetical protein